MKVALEELEWPLPFCKWNFNDLGSASAAFSIRLRGQGFQVHTVNRPRLQSCLCRPSTDPSASVFRTDKRAFFIICTSELGPPQIYGLVALTSSDKNT